MAAAGVAVGVLAVSWSGLYLGVAGGRVLLLSLLAMLPALATLAPRRRSAWLAAALVVAAASVLALATRSSLGDVVTFDGAAWSAIGSVVPDGLEAGSHSGLPVSPADEPALVALLDLALALLAGAAAWQIVARRRPVVGLVVVGAGLAYRWTVQPPDSGILAGVMALAALAAVLALSGREPGTPVRPGRHLAGALILGAVAVIVAAGLGAGPAKAGDPWWAWKSWDVGVGGPGDGSGGGGLDLRQRYGKLDWPATARVAFTVKTDRARPLKALSLGDFDGVAFTFTETGGSRPLPVSRGAITVTGADPTGKAVTQDVAFVGASSPLLLASGRPARVTGPFSGTADMVGDAIRLESPIEPGDHYVVRTRVPQPTPSQLVTVAPYEQTAVPEGATALRGSFYGPTVDMPLWGTFGVPPTDAALGPYAQVRDLARRVVGDAATPYAAVNRIEAYLRSQYTYDEAPPFPTSLPADWPAGQPADDPPLVDFLMHSRRGFCQHFAGSMAVMLRSLGIPSRVAVGYTGGGYDSESGRYRVLDRDAHSWVEVWFPGYGWLPFDPTPGRSAENPASVSSPDYAPTPVEIDTSGLTRSAVDPPPSVGPPPTPTSTPADPAADAPAPAAGGGGPGLPDRRWALLLLLVPLGVAPVRRALRRARGRRGGDDRTRVVAATRELEASLAPLGLAPPDTASASERAEAIRARTGVDPSALYRRASAARFAAEPPPRGEAAAAWRELARLRRDILRGAPLRRRLPAALGIRVPTRDTLG